MADALYHYDDAVRGRGASSNPRNRFESREYEAEDDLEPDAHRPATRYLPDTTKNILARNDSPDVGFDVSINPYRGCEHGCIYCYARPTHEYLGFSPGLDFETRIMVKEDAPELLREALRSPKWTPKPIGMSGVTDPYQPVEKKLAISRRCLEVAADFRQPMLIVTKNRLVSRDIDVLRELAKYKAVAVFISLTTLDLKLNRILEPRTSSPHQRLDAIAELHDAGIPVGTLIAPIIPALTDSETPALIEAAASAGARHAGYVVLRLPLAVAPLFERWLGEHYPDRKDRVLNRLRSMRGGDLYRAQFGNRMRGEGPYADQIASFFHIACSRAGIRERVSVSTESFRRPVQHGDQTTLF